MEVRATAPGVGTFYWRTRSPETGKTIHHKLGRTTEIDLETARDKVRQLRAKQILGLDVDGKKESRSKKAIPTLTEFMEQQYIPHKRDSGKRGWMRDRDLFHNHLRPVFGNQRLNEITLHSIQLFLSSMHSRGYAAATCNHPVKVLRHALSLAHRWQIIDTNPASHVSLIRESNIVNNLLTEDELARLVKVLQTDKNKMVCAVCMFLLSTGARLNEALASRWEHFDFAHRTWTIPSEHSKSGKIRSIPLNQSAINILESLGTREKYSHPFIARGGKPFTTINRVWTRLRNEAGLPHLRLHDLRHNYASMLINSGRNLYEVQNILGHSDPSVTQRYAHLSTKSMQDAADSADDIISKAMRRTA